MELRTKTDWRGVAIAVLAGVIAAAHYGKAPAALPSIREEITISLIVGGWIMSIFSGTGSLLGVAMGTLSDGIGARRFCMMGLAGISVGAIMGSFVDSGEWLLASRFLEGLGFISVAVSTPVLIIRSTAPKDLQLTLGIWTTYMPGGMALSIAVSPILLTMVDWRTVWLGLSAMSALWMLLILWTFEGEEQREGERPPLLGELTDNLKTTLARPGPWLLSLAFGFYTIQWISLMAWLPSFLYEERGVALGTVGLITAAVVFANVPGNLTSGFLMKRGMARATTLLISALGMAVTVYGIFESSLPDLMRLSLCVAFSYFGGMLPGAVLSGAPVVAPSPKQVGTVNGMMVQGSHIGQMIGPPILAAVVTATGDWGDTRWLLIASSGVIVLLAYAFRRFEIK